MGVFGPSINRRILSSRIMETRKTEKETCEVKTTNIDDMMHSKEA